MQRRRQDNADPNIAQGEIANRNGNERNQNRCRYLLSCLIPLICISVPIGLFIYDLTRPAEKVIITDKLDNIVGKFEAFTKCFEQLESDNKRLSYSLETLTAAFGSYRTEKEKQIENTGSDIKILQGKVVDATKEQGKLTGLVKQLESSTEKFKEDEKEIEKLQSDIEKLWKDINGVIQTQEDSTNQIAQLKTWKRESERKRKMLRETIVSLETSTEEVSDNLELAERRIIDIEVDNSNILKRLDEITKRQGIPVSQEQLASKGAANKVEKRQKGAKTSAQVEDMSNGCPEGYFLNLHSKTCITMVKLSKTWDNAKKYCEGHGESLATFETTESVKWISKLIKTTPGWHGYSTWIGGKFIDGNWVWKGVSTKLMGRGAAAGWDEIEPDGPSECVGMAGVGGCRFSAVECTYVRRFLCERTLI